MSSHPPLRQLNRTFIGSVLFIDIVGYSRRIVPEQLEMKELFNTLLSDAVQNVAASERIMVDTGDGAAIAFLGDPEDALFAALSLRDAIDAGRAHSVGEPGFVRMGINLGPLKIVRDINGHTNMIGDGVNDAQRVMSFAEPGQVMVAHSYYDIISRFSHDYAQLFVYEGTRQDKHVREHEVYRFGPVGDHNGLTEKLRDRSRARVAAELEQDSPAFAPGKARHQTTGKRNLAGSSRAGLIATAVGALTLAGAVWSWTSHTSHPAPAAAPLGLAATGTPSTASDPIAVLAASAAAVASGSVPASAPAKRETAVNASAAPAKSEEIKVAAKTPEASAKASIPATTATTAAPPVKPGTVQLAIQPWGEIYVDGGKRGITPPLKALSLPPGKHRIEVRNGEFAPYKETVEVKSDAETTLHYTF